MDKKKWLGAMSYADEKYVKEADPRGFRKSSFNYKKALALAACFCLVVTVAALYLFVPFSTTPPDVSKYSGSEYYPIITKLNDLTFTKPRYKNNFDKLFSTLTSIKFDDDVMAGGDAAPEDAPSSSNGSYEEITDNQAAGVIEADRIKRSSTHIYYMYSDTLEIYSIAGEDSVKVGEYRIFESESFKDTNIAYTGEWELFLSEDCKTITIIAPHYKNGVSNVGVLSLDVSDPANILEKGFISVNGYYKTSRLVDGDILLITEYSLMWSKIDFSDESTFLPSINVNGESTLIPAEDIISPDTLTSSRYTVVIKLDGDTLSSLGVSAFLSYSDEVYVSESNVYASRGFSETENTDDGMRSTKVMTEISAISYGENELAHLGNIVIEGSVKNRFSLDEYENVLRVFTTTSQNLDKVSTNIYNDDVILSDTLIGTKTNANLYCIDISDFSIIASVIGFAPQGESVESARFDGNTAYACTAVVITLKDPVYFFDLTDPHNITYTDTGTIDGFSTSLIDFGNALIGIGVGDLRDTFKVEAYERQGDKIVSIDSYELKNTTYSNEYKSYYIDRANFLIGVPVYQYNYNSNAVTKYVLLLFDGYELHEVLASECAGAAEAIRGFYFDGYFYILDEAGLTVEKAMS